jgi:hypothetical protein
VSRREFVLDAVCDVPILYLRCFLFLLDSICLLRHFLLCLDGRRFSHSSPSAFWHWVLRRFQRRGQRPLNAGHSSSGAWSFGLPLSNLQAWHPEFDKSIFDELRVVCPFFLDRAQTKSRRVHPSKWLTPGRGST